MISRDTRLELAAGSALTAAEYLKDGNVEDARDFLLHALREIDALKNETRQ